MTISSAAQSPERAASIPREKAATPPPEEHPTPRPDPRQPDLRDIRGAAELAALGKDLRPGDKIIVRLGPDQVAEISKEGPDRWNSFKAVISDIGISTVRALNEAIQEDPSFTLREAVEIAKRRIQETNLEGLKDMTLNGLVPAVRAVALALDVMQARRTFSHPEAGFVDKVIDGGHVITDIMGVLGSLTGLVPALSAIPGVQHFVTTAVTADIVAFGYHLLRWFRKTGNRPFGGEKDPSATEARERQSRVQVRVNGVPQPIAVPATASTLAALA